jgi:hypothetical protein
MRVRRLLPKQNQAHERTILPLCHCVDLNALALKEIPNPHSFTRASPRRNLSLGSRCTSTSPLRRLPLPLPPRCRVIVGTPPTMYQTERLSFSLKCRRLSLVPNSDELVATMGRVSLGALQETGSVLCSACRHLYRVCR